MKKRMLCILSVAAVAAGSAQALELKLWQLPKGASPASREGWVPASARDAFKNGLAVDNGRIAAVFLPSAAGPILVAWNSETTSSVATEIVPEKAQPDASMDRVGVARSNETELVVGIGLGSCSAEVRIPAGKPFVEFAPVKGCAAVDVNCSSRCQPKISS